MATIKDIAKAAQVSPAAVSRILNQDDTLNVSSDTREKVLKIAKELNYVKKGRSSKSTFHLGILQWFSSQQELEDDYYLLIRQGIEAYCSQNQIQLSRAYKTDMNYIDMLKSVDSIICIGKFSTTEVEYFHSLNSHILFLDMPVTDPSISAISLDFHQAVLDVLEYLSELGHTSIGLFTGKEYVDETILYPDYRKETFTKWCKEHQITYKPFMKEGQFTMQSGYDMALELIKSKILPTAIFAASDPIALGSIKAFTEHGYRIPEDLSIVGFNDISMSAFANPPLTTIHAPAYHMGYYGTSILHHMIREQTDTAMKITLPCKLVIRDTAAQPK